MARDWKLCLFLLTVFVCSTISIPQAEKGLEYYFYSPLGQKSSEEFLFRAKREGDDETNELNQKKENPADSADSVASSVTVKTTTANLTSAVSKPNTNTTSSSTTEQQKTEVEKPIVTDIGKARGFIPPENETTILKEIADSDIPQSKINETVESHKQSEGLKNITDNHKYYSSSTFPFKNSWIDLNEWNNTKHPGIVHEHSMLSKSYRRAATIALTFPFPFYGHMVKNITIATGGFLYTGEYVHSWLAATQYIAPLMANFDTSQEDSATVKYADNGTTLVVEWGNVYLQGREGANMEGPFTFQAILHESGDIIFAYKTIPVSINRIADEEHPVKVGLSDAYIIERTIFFVRRKTIYEYHRVNMKGQKIANNTAIRLKALPRCNMKRNCKECLALTVEESGKEVPCMWCSLASLCSDGLDRNKQNWLKSSCDESRNHLSGRPEVCDSAPKSSWSGSDRDYHNPSYTIDDHPKNDQISDNYNTDIGHNEESDHFKDSKSNVHHTGVALLTIVIILIITIFGWCLYAYFFPHTCSGQLLIKYRPSRWHWRRGEPRYTAASIHM